MLPPRPQYSGRVAKLRRIVPSPARVTRSAMDCAASVDALEAASARVMRYRRVIFESSLRLLRDQVFQELRGARIMRLAEPEDRLAAQLLVLVALRDVHQLV